MNNDLYTFFITCSGVILGILLHGFFALVRTALIRARASVLKQAPHNDAFGTARARILLAKANHHINTAQTGTFIAGGIAYVCAWFLIQFLNLHSVYISFSLMILIFALVTFIGVISSAIQRGLAYWDPNLMLRLVAYPFSILGMPLIPIAWLSAKILAFFAKKGFRIPKERDLIVSAEQISEMVDISSQAGQIEEEEREMIQGIFEFSDTNVGEVMTPRQDITGISVSCSVKQAVDLFSSAKHTRILAYGKNIDDVKGVLIAKDLLPLVGKSIDGYKLSSFVRKVMTVSSDEKVDVLLEQFKKRALHFAVVLDEHGGVDGIVTLEDLIEELIGDIYDEYDEPDDEIEHIETSSGDIIVDGGALIDDLNSEYDLHLPQGEYDTIAGYVIHELGTIPDVGELVQYNGYKILVEELDNNRITQLRILKREQEISNS